MYSIILCMFLKIYAHIHFTFVCSSYATFYLSITNNAVINISVHVYLCPCARIFMGYISEGKLLGHRVFALSSLLYTAKLFPIND